MSLPRSKHLALSTAMFFALAGFTQRASAHGDVDEPVHVAGPVSSEPEGPQDELAPTPGEPPPHGYHLDRRPRRDVAVGGLGLAIAGYVPAVLTSIDCAIAACRGTHAGWELALAVPIAGPLVYVPARCLSGDKNCVIGAAFWIADAAVQTLGVVLYLYGSHERDVWVRDGSASRAPAVHVSPRVLGDRSWGLGATLVW